MKFLIEAFSFCVGGTLTVFWFSFVLLPFVYGLPKAVSWTFRGILKKRAALLFLVSFVVWNTVCLTAAIFLAVYFPNAAQYLLESPWFAAGQLVALLFSTFYALSAEGRQSLQVDFLDAVGHLIRKNVTP